jgi:hypothetical protein
MVALMVLALSSFWLIVVMFLVNDYLNHSLHPNEWQPWITGLGVITAAFLSVWQQHKIEERETKQRQRKSIAVRAVMPAALAEICQYAEECAENITGHYPHTAELNMLCGRLPIPKFPSGAIDILRDCIEHADEADIFKIAECIRQLQIQHSRLSTLLSRSSMGESTKDDYDSILINTIEIHAYCS